MSLLSFPRVGGVAVKSALAGAIEVFNLLEDPAHHLVERERGRGSVLSCQLLCRVRVVERDDEQALPHAEARPS